MALGQLWRQLSAGHLVVSATHCAAGRCFAEVVPRCTVERVAPPALKKLERFLLGTSQKLLAFEYKVSNATIASQCAAALNAMAPGQTASRAAILLVMAAHAAHGTPLEPARVDAELDGSRRLISCAVPGASLFDRLSPCESAVAQLLIEGKMHVEIAAERKTSVRTTANQLASIFSKLGVSGRNELRSCAILGISTKFARRQAITSLPAQALERRPLSPLGRPVLTGVAV